MNEKSRGKIKYIMGIDEAGRGPLAGPITVAVVYCRICDIRIRYLFRGIKDSKKLSPKKREEWRNKFKIQNSKFKMTNQNAKLLFFATASVAPRIIDRIGITKATAAAVKNAIKNLERKVNIKPTNCHIFLDGLLKAPKKYSQETIIKGDEKIPVISAASIIAKVTRDRKMLKLHKNAPQYRFDLHKGYPTKLHYEMLARFGLSPHHRKSYLKNRLFTV